MFAFAAPLTFAVTGMSTDKQVYSVLGSGFFVAPFTAITAAHVVRGLWDLLEMPWKQGHYPKQTVEPCFELAAAQQVDPNNSYLTAHWKITGATPLGYTDIAFLNLVPNDPISEHFLWPAPFPALQLTPPELGSRIWSFGYAEAEYKHAPGSAVVDIEAQPKLMEGQVTGHYPHGRGTWRFPQFEVSSPFDPGMSGGPLIHEGRVCGLVSYGPELEAGQRGLSFAAALWPLLASVVESGVDPRVAPNPVLEMIVNGAISAPEWRQIQSRITAARTDGGDPILELHM
jgi:Trypsin-like peptidase domain